MSGLLFNVLRSTLFAGVVASVGLVAATTETTSSKSAGNQRIIALNGSATEVLFALGVGSQVVGRDDSSYFPPEVMKIPSIGYQYVLNSEALLALKPSLVVGRSDARPESALERLKESGARLLVRPEPVNLEQATDRIREIGAAVGAEDKAASLVEDMNKDILVLQKKIQDRKASGKPPVKAAALYVRGTSTAMILGNKTGPAAMIEVAGGLNLFGDLESSKPLTPESLAAAAPEVIVVMRGGVQSAGGIEALLERPDVKMTPAGKNRRVIVMDDLYLGGFGPRAAKAALDLYKGFYESEGIYEADGLSTSTASRR